MILKVGRRKQSKGFTFIELVVVAVIIVVLVALSSPRFRATLREVELKDTAYTISKLIKYGQQRAIVGEKKHRLLFNFEKETYHLLIEDEEAAVEVPVPTEGESITGEEIETEEIEPATNWKRITGRFGGYFYLPEGIRFRGEKEKITFLPNGRCDKISLYITNQKNRTFKIETNGRAGYVKISEPKEGE